MKFLHLQPVYGERQGLSEIFFENTKRLIRVDVEQISIAPVLLIEKMHMGCLKQLCERENELDKGQSLVDFSGTKVLFNVSASELPKMLKEFSVSGHGAEGRLQKAAIDKNNLADVIFRKTEMKLPVL